MAQRHFRMVGREPVPGGLVEPIHSGLQRRDSAPGKAFTAETRCNLPGSFKRASSARIGGSMYWQGLRSCLKFFFSGR
ncbi:hypothetical protein NDU88_003396 [Pleurodeles waltl]|uniref:Uncharacterized protein n=1 Tax=Pleurodeles waltl TaxID=8319 RepID=A0AAV7MVG9_PLEWA|nr:hypothetical protein NDU88_003396 [Pleurodeles waltl]